MQIILHPSNLLNSLINLNQLPVGTLHIIMSSMNNGHFGFSFSNVYTLFPFILITPAKIASKKLNTGSVISNILLLKMKFAIFDCTLHQVNKPSSIYSLVRDIFKT